MLQSTCFFFLSLVTVGTEAGMIVSTEAQLQGTDHCTKSLVSAITCSTVVLQCYRRQAIPMEQAKIRPSVTLYSLDRSLPNLIDYVGDPYPYANFTWIWFGGEFPANR